MRVAGLIEELQASGLDFLFWNINPAPQPPHLRFGLTHALEVLVKLPPIALAELAIETLGLGGERLDASKELPRLL